MLIKNKKKIRRGEIYYHDFAENSGSIQSGIRPVLILQCNEGNDVSPTTIVAAITTSVKKQYLPSHIVLSDNFGLREESMVMLEQLSVINTSDLKRYIGRIDDLDVIKEINLGLEKVLGIRLYKPKSYEEVSCLCKKCLDDYIATKQYKVRRINPYNNTKHTCVKCGGNGYDYAISERKFHSMRGDGNV